MGVFEDIKFLWHNGKIIPKEEFKLPLWTWTLHYGAGVFEGLRFYEGNDNSYIVRPNDHIGRMFDSAKIYMMKIPFTQEQIIQGMKDSIKANKQKGGYIRPIAYFGPMKELGLKPKETPIWVGIFTIPFGRYLGEDALEKGIRCCVSSWTRHHPNIMPPEAKCNANYANSMLASRGAMLDGYAEAIMLDPLGYVSEGPGENIFLVKDGVIRTPPLASSVLPGITRDCVMKIAKNQGVVVKEEIVTRGQLYIADEIFFTGTAGEVTPITEIDHRTIGSGKRGPITKKLQEIYFNAVTGKDPKYKDWIMKVY
jgi:branched-chain amino acid aminotransferase